MIVGSFNRKLYTAVLEMVSSNLVLFTELELVECEIFSRIHHNKTKTIYQINEINRAETMLTIMPQEFCSIHQSDVERCRAVVLVVVIQRSDTLYPHHDMFSFVQRSFPSDNVQMTNVQIFTYISVQCKQQPQVALSSIFLKIYSFLTNPYILCAEKSIFLFFLS